jgi:membrane associated rhomboid family serine protease
MIPIRDINPAKTVPVVNYAIIGLNVFVFLAELLQGGDMARFVYYYGLVPSRYSSPEIAAYFSFGQQAFSFLSFMFLHGGFLHIIGNMWFLYIFGDNVEDHLGPYRYLAFYLLCGVLSGVSHMLFNIHSNVPVVGASGAVAGVMGAYLILYPRAKVLTLVPIIIIPFFFELPAFVFMGLWFLIQFLNAAASFGNATDIAWWAHIGGFLFGILFLRLLGRVPSTGVTQFTQQLAERKTTHRLQVIRPTGPVDDPNLYGTIMITPHEALRGTQKVVNIPWGFHNQMIRVTVPADTREGNILRLADMGKRMPDGRRGDLMLTVAFEAYQR